jgi:hypothetical protein
LVNSALLLFWHQLASCTSQNTPASTQVFQSSNPYDMHYYYHHTCTHSITLYIFWAMALPHRYRSDHIFSLDSK